MIYGPENEIWSKKRYKSSEFPRYFFFPVLIIMKQVFHLESSLGCQKNSDFKLFSKIVQNLTLRTFSCWKIGVCQQFHGFWPSAKMSQKKLYSNENLDFLQSNLLNRVQNITLSQWAHYEKITIQLKSLVFHRDFFSRKFELLKSNIICRKIWSKCKDSLIPNVKIIFCHL